MWECSGVIPEGKVAPVPFAGLTPVLAPFLEGLRSFRSHHVAIAWVRYPLVNGEVNHLAKVTRAGSM